MGNNNLINPDLLVTGIKPVAGEYDGTDLSELISFEKDKIYSKFELLELTFNVPDNVSQAKTIISYLFFLVECFYNSEALQEAVELGLIAEIIYDDSIHQCINNEKPKIPITGIKPVAGEFVNKDLSDVIRFEADKYYSKADLEVMAEELKSCQQQLADFEVPEYIHIWFDRNIGNVSDVLADIDAILYEAENFIRYLIECFDDPEKLQEAQKKGYIVDVRY